jgi:hypothetical protein
VNEYSLHWNVLTWAYSVFIFKKLGTWYFIHLSALRLNCTEFRVGLIEKMNLQIKYDRDLRCVLVLAQPLLLFLEPRALGVESRPIACD